MHRSEPTDSSRLIARARWLMLLLALAMVVTSAACGDDDQAAPDPGPGQAVATTDLVAAVPSPFGGDDQLDTTFVGALDDDPSTYVALVVDDDQAIAFFCDGATRWGWLEGAADGDELTLTGNGATLTATRSGDGITGTLSAPDHNIDAAELEAHVADEREGLYRDELGPDTDPVTLGWILSEHGARGLVRNKDGSVEAALVSDATTDPGFGNGGAGGNGALDPGGVADTNVAALSTCADIQQAIDQHYALAASLNKRKPKTQEIKELLADIGENLMHLQEAKLFNGC